MSARAIRFQAVLITALVLLTLGGYPAGAAWAQEATQKELTRIYGQARKAILDIDVETFEKAVILAKPGAKKMTKEDLAEAKDFVDDILPDLATSKFLRVVQKDDQALLILQTYLDDQENITLSRFKFKRQDGGWRLIASFASKTFSKENPKTDEENIKNTLDTSAEFQVADQEKAAAPPPPPAKGEVQGDGSGSGYLTVGKATYHFGSALAYRKKAEGYDNKIDIIVVLTEAPLNVEAVKAELKKDNDWRDFVSHLKLAIAQDLQTDFVWFWVKQDSLSQSTSPVGVETSVKVEGERIKGTVKMAKPVKIFDETYIFDVAFDAPIVAP